MVSSEDINALDRAARVELTITSREKRWTHLSLCVLDAVFSINAKYRTVVHVRYRYALHASLPGALLAVSEADGIAGTAKEQRRQRHRQPATHEQPGHAFTTCGCWPAATYT